MLTQISNSPEEQRSTEMPKISGHFPKAGEMGTDLIRILLYLRKSKNVRGDNLEIKVTTNLM